MKKIITISILCVLQAACASQGSATRPDGVLLSFNDLAKEIKVGMEVIDTPVQAPPADESPRGTP